jgi:type IV secretion system protein VirB6
MFAQLGVWLSQFLNGYVARVSGDLSTALVGIATAWLTVYIANYGYAVVRGEVQEPLSVFGWKMVKMAFILGIALSGGRYMDIVFSTANGLQDSMATVFLRGGPYNQSAPTTVFGALDTANNTANDILKDLWRDAGITRLDLVMASVTFSLGTIIFLLFGAFVTLLSKVILCFALAIGPMAVLALMFKPTSKYFDAWTGLVLSAVVLAWFVFFALGLSFFVAQNILDSLRLSGAFTAGGVVSAIEGAATYLTFMVMLAVVLYQAPHLASQLTGGASIQTGGQMAAAGLAVQRLLGGAGKSPPVGGGGPGAGAGGGSVNRGPGLAYQAGSATGRAATSAANGVVAAGGAAAVAAGTAGRWAYQRAADLGNRKK